MSQYWCRGQRDAYNQILSFSETNKGEIVFLDAPGGTGKTFVINLLLAKFQQQKKITLAVASSGIAATLLKGGRKAHSTFKLPSLTWLIVTAPGVIFPKDQDWPNRFKSAVT
ncbi:G-quadruplex DNA unwinding [Pristimantis euphronides]